MSDNIVLCNETNFDREELQKQRRERKKIKKEARRLEKKQEYDRKLLQLKFGPIDQHIKIVSRQFVDGINTFKEVHHTNAAIPEFLAEDHFPKLGQSSHRHTSSQDQQSTSHINSLPTSSKQLTCKPSKRLLTINIQDAIEKLEQPVKEISIVSNKYSGNLLDSSQPERRKGKHREVPRPKRPTKFKSLIQKESKCQNEIEYQSIHSPKFETYCDNIITEELNDNIKILLTNIVKFQENLYKRCPLKGVAKRRYVVGFREIKNCILVNKVQILIIAPNLKNAVPNGIINETVNEIRNLAVMRKIPYVFGLSRRILGHLILKHIPISCIGILRHEGSEESFEKVIQLQQSTKEAYQKLQAEFQIIKNDTTETNQTNEHFLKTLQYCIHT